MIVIKDVVFCKNKAVSSEKRRAVTPLNILPPSNPFIGSKLITASERLDDAMWFAIKICCSGRSRSEISQSKIVRILAKGPERAIRMFFPYETLSRICISAPRGYMVTDIMLISKIRVVRI